MSSLKPGTTLVSEDGQRFRVVKAIRIGERKFKIVIVPLTDRNEVKQL